MGKCSDERDAKRHNHVGNELTVPHLASWFFGLASRKTRGVDLSGREWVPSSRRFEGTRGCVDVSLQVAMISVMSEMERPVRFSPKSESPMPST